MSKQKSKLMKRMCEETGIDFDCVYEFYELKNGRKRLYEQKYDISYREAEQYLDFLYKEKTDGAFIMEIKTINFRQLVPS